MKVLIIEDERPAALKLIRLIKDIDASTEIEDILSSVEASLNWFLNHPEPDLVFMDIQLEDGICFEIFERYKLKVPVIFTTAYDEYSLKAFRVNSVDYLLKPVDPADLRRALDKFKNIHFPKPGLQNIESAIDQLPTGNKERFLVKIGQHFRPVQTTDIDCFYVSDGGCFMQDRFGKNYPLDYSLDKIQKHVDSSIFFRVNRNYILHFDAIKDIIIYSTSRLKIILRNSPAEEEVIVSRDRVGSFKEWMGGGREE